CLVIAFVTLAFSGVAVLSLTRVTVLIFTRVAVLIFISSIISGCDCRGFHIRWQHRIQLEFLWRGWSLGHGKGERKQVSCIVKRLALRRGLLSGIQGIGGVARRRYVGEVVQGAVGPLTLVLEEAADEVRVLIRAVIRLQDCIESV